MAVASGKPIPSVERLAAAGASLGFKAIGLLALGLALSVVEIAAFGWEPGEMIGGALAGTAVWGAVDYLLYMRAMVPRGVLQDAPRDVEVEFRRTELVSWRWVVGSLALVVPIAWLADRFGAGAFVIPGAIFGQALSALAALAQIRRWEKANGRRIVFDPEADDARPYAGLPP